MIVDVFLHKMIQAQVDLQKQAQIDLQNQLEQATEDLKTRPLLNDSPVLHIDTPEQTPPNFHEQMEHTKVEHETPKTDTLPDDTDHTRATPPPPKKRSEIMKDPIFRSSPIYPLSIPSKISLCTNRLSRFEVYPTSQTFCGKPDPLYSTQYSDLFVTYTNGFNMRTGQPNSHSMIDEYISGKIVLDNSINKFVFPAINVSNNFATIENDAHINTKIDYTINHVFLSMTVQEPNTLHTICELERNQLLTILAMSVQNPQLAGFLLTGNRSNFLYVEGSTAWL